MKLAKVVLIVLIAILLISIGFYAGLIIVSG